MTFKGFIVGFVLTFLIIEVISVIIGYIRKKKELKNIKELEENNNDVSSTSNFKE